MMSRGMMNWNTDANIVYQSLSIGVIAPANPPLLQSSMQSKIFCSGAPCSSGIEYLDTIICSRLSSLVLYMMGKARPQESSEMQRKTSTAPRLLICRDWDLTMNLYLSTAMAMLVREDMYT